MKKVTITSVPEGLKGWLSAVIVALPPKGEEYEEFTLVFNPTPQEIA